VILYRMLTGKLPFEGPNSMAVIYKQVTELPKPLYEISPDIPALLNAVVMRAMEKEPDRRPSDVMTFARELSAAVKVVTEQEFQKVFLNATDEDLDAAVLLTLDVSRVNHDSAPDQFRSGTADANSLRVISSEKRVAYSPSENESTKTELEGIPSVSLPILAPTYLHGRFPECDIGSVVHTLIGLELTGSLLFYTDSAAAAQIAKSTDNENLPSPFCSIYFERGSIDRAKLGVRIGAEAFFQLLQMPVEGSYILRPALLFEDLERLDTIIANGEELWKEAINLKMELEEYLEIFPNLLAQIEVCTERLEWEDRATLDLADSIWQLASQPETDLALLLAKAPCCNAKTYRVLTLLLSTEQVRLIDPF
jgi:hypothetical protein